MSRKTWFFIAAAGFLVAGGWACGKLGSSNSAGISNSQVVATVNGKDITFGDWMRQVDLLRVLVPEGRGLDPTNSQQVNQVLDTLVNQELVLAALRKKNYTDLNFDQTVQRKLEQAKLQLKDDKDQLAKDLKAIQRLEKNYADPLKEYLLAQNFASTQKDSVGVSEKETKDLYENYARKYKQAGREIPPYSKVKELLKEQMQADKLYNSLREGQKVNRQEETIQKYLISLSPSRGILGSDSSSAPPAAVKDKKAN